MTQTQKKAPTNEATPESFAESILPYEGKADRLAMQYLHFPDELKGKKLWMCADGIKAPKSTHYNKILNKKGDKPLGWSGSVYEPDTWDDFESCLSHAGKKGYEYLCMVLMYPYVGIDLDHCYDPETQTFTRPECEQIIRLFEGKTYIEHSRSRTGFHIICKGTKPKGDCKKNDMEMYQTVRNPETGKTDGGRTFNCTGFIYGDCFAVTEMQSEVNRAFEMMGLKKERPVQERVTASPLQAVEDDELIKKLETGLNAEKFARLMNGDVSDYQNDESLGDYWLCRFVADYTSDPAQIQRIFELSALSQREKWTRPDYRERTISKAIEGAESYRAIREIQGIELWEPDNSGTDSSVDVQKSAEEQAQKALEAVQSDPAYIPDSKAYAMAKTQETLEAGEIIHAWDGITDTELAVIQEVDKELGKYSQLIQHFNGSFKRFRDPKKWAEHDCRRLAQAALKANVSADKVADTVLAIYKRSAVYQRAHPQLDLVVPGETVTVLDGVIAAQIRDLTAEGFGLPTYKTEHGAFLHEVAAADFMDRYTCRYHKDSDQLLVWLNGRYTNNTNEIEREVVAHFMGHSKAAARREMLRSVTLKSEVIDSDPDPDLIAFRNGVLNIRTQAFMPHSEDLFFLNVIPHDYVPNPEPVALVDETLHRWACGDPEIVQNILEMIGACMYRGNPLQRFFCLTGEGANGKSVLIDMMTDLLGPDNVSGVPIEGLEERFQSANLFGKLANLSAENEPGYVRHTATLKKLSGGRDKIHAEFKGRDAFDFLCYATAVFSFNELPRFNDPTGAVKRRNVPIPFRATFVDDDSCADSDRHIYPIRRWLTHDLTQEQSLQYLIAKAIQAYAQALAVGKIVISAAGREILEKMDIENNHVVRFVERMREERNEPHYPVGEETKMVWYHYDGFCKEERIRSVMGMSSLTREIQKRFGLDRGQKKKDGKNLRIFTMKRD